MKTGAKDRITLTEAETGRPVQVVIDNMFTPRVAVAYPEVYGFNKRPRRPGRRELDTVDFFNFDPNNGDMSEIRLKQQHKSLLVLQTVRELATAMARKDFNLHMSPAVLARFNRELDEVGKTTHIVHVPKDFGLSGAVTGTATFMTSVSEIRQALAGNVPLALARPAAGLQIIGRTQPPAFHSLR